MHARRVFDCHRWNTFLCVLLSAQIASTAQIAGPLVASANPNYFKDANGSVLILNGSQTWNTFQDWGSTDTSKRWISTISSNSSARTVITLPCCGPLRCRNSVVFQVRPSSPAGSGPPGPLPWLRTGPGNATDDGLKFDSHKV